MRRILFLIFALVLLASLPAQAEVVEIINRFGGIRILSDPGTGFKVGAEGLDRPVHQGDIRIRREPGRIFVICEPSDKARINLIVRVTYEVPIAAQTVNGPIELNGYFPDASITTETGGLHLSSPWAAVTFNMVSEQAPDSVVFPKNWPHRVDSKSSRQLNWTVYDELPENRMTYGSMRVKAVRPSKLELINIPIPENAPVKMHWQAPEIVDEILASIKPVKTSATTAAKSSGDGEFVFRSDVRVVNLQLSVRDESGQPVKGLTAADFEVLEDGVPQTLTAVSRDEIPFNLAILLDLSGSTRNSRKPMETATKRFVELARPQDKVALYALAQSSFRVLSPLSQDRARLLRIVEDIPRIEGGSPVYDVIVLAYAEELQKHPGEKNVIIVVSDGMDNQIAKRGTGSETSFKKLLQAAGAFDTLLYPVLLDPYPYNPPSPLEKKATEQMTELTRASGGRVFNVSSVQDLESAYPLVAEELSNVQSVAYSPKNQNFNGAWRKVEVRVKRRGVTVVTRPGYFAR